MRTRQILLRGGLAVIAVAVSILLAARILAPPELQWRLQLVHAKLTGELNEIPASDLLAWLAPGSPVYLSGAAKNLNLDASVKNLLVSPDDVSRGAELYLRHCGQCHGEGGHGYSAPNLLDVVANKSDWHFLSTAKWGLTGTQMLPQSVSDLQVWQIHAFLRSKALATLGQPNSSARALSDGHFNVSARQIIDTDTYPGQWLTYAGNYSGHRHSPLTELTKHNVSDLRLAWVAQLRQVDRDLETSPVVAGGVMFVSESRDGVVAIDAESGDVIWKFRRPVPEGMALCCGMPNRGVAVLGQTVYVATIDSFLIALDANTGEQRWQVRVADYRQGYSMSGAPLALKDHIVVGVAGGEFSIRGFLAAFDPEDGRLLWKFYTVPRPGETGSETWTGEAWKTGGAPTWTVGAYDPKLDLIYWGTGNPAPAFQAGARPGDNLFASSVIAIEAKSGRLRWHYQFTPADEHDWDAAQQPVLADIVWKGLKRSVVLWANRNAFFYALDRETGEFLYAKPFVKQTWNLGFDGNGRPKKAGSARPSPSGSVVWPASMTATNWWPPSYDRSRQLVFVPCSDAAGIYFQSEDVENVDGEQFVGSAASFYAKNLPTSAHIKAIDTTTGEVRWQSTLASGAEGFDWTVGGVLSTANGVVFAGYRKTFRAFDADSGAVLWKVNLGARVRGSPISFAIAGKQYIAVAAGHSMFAFEIQRD